MPEATVRRPKTPSAWFILVLLLAIPISLLAQSVQVGAGRGGRGGQRVAVPGGAPGAPPAGGPAAAPAAQGRGGIGGGGAAGGAAARGAAPVDLTGYWVSIVTEDWI